MPYKGRYIFRQHSIETLILDSYSENFDVLYLNDDTSGRLLYGLFQANVSKLFIELSLSCMKKQKQNVKCIHMDSTPFHPHEEKYCDDSSDKG